MKFRKHTHKMCTWLLFLFLAGCGSSDGLGSSTSASVPKSEGAAVAAQATEAAPLMRTANIATFKKASDWGSGFTGEITITNNTGKTIKDWQVTFTMPATVSSIWNATETNRTGNVHNVVAKSYNNSITAGQSISFGFNATPGGAAVTATNITVDWPEEGGTTGGTSGTGTSGTGTSGSGTSGTGTSGTGTSGTGTSGTGTSGTGTSGTGTSGTGSTTGTTGGTTTPAGQVNYTVSSNWGSGFGAQVEIRNPGTTAIQNWTLEFTLPANIDNLWNGSIQSHTGTTYKVAPASYNSTIPAGGSVSFGFNGSPGGSSATATNFVLSGQPVTPTNPNPDPSPTTTPTPDPDPVPNPNPPAAGYFSTSGSKIIDSQGNTVYLNGINWFGLETETSSPHGLWTRSMDSMLDQMKGLGYNTLRVPYSNDAMKPGNMALSIDASKNPDLTNKTSLQVLDALVTRAGQRNMRIILDRHCPVKDVQSDLWYTSQVSEEQWISDWEMLAKRYKGNPTVIGADLHNEPYGRATWGSGQTSTDWRLAAQRCGNRILAANPDWLIIVEGIESVNGNNYWWGGNLRNAGAYPVTLTVPNKVVYSTHDYPSTVYNQSWFSAANYPANLSAVWDANWGYLLKGNIAPVLVGEFGTKYETQSDQQWLGELVKYIKANGAQFTYWCWNENSRDTGGILKSDWTTVNTAKQNALTPLMSR